MAYLINLYLMGEQEVLFPRMEVTRKYWFSLNFSVAPCFYHHQTFVFCHVIKVFNCSGFKFQWERRMERNIVKFWLKTFSRTSSLKNVYYSTCFENWHVCGSLAAVWAVLLARLIFYAHQSLEILWCHLSFQLQKFNNQE